MIEKVIYLDWDLYWLNEGGNAIQMCIRREFNSTLPPLSCDR